MTSIAIEMKSIQDVVDDSEILRTTENRRTFEYNLNDKNAKSKLVKGAKREPFDVVHNQLSCNLVFSVGSWKQLALPTVQYWSKNRINKTCTIDDIEITIVSIKTGKDVIGKHIDTQVIFFVNRSKVVCHF